MDYPKLSISILLLFGTVLLVNPIKAQNTKFNITISKQDLMVIVDETELLYVNLRGTLEQNLTLKFIQQHLGLIESYPNTIEFTNESARNNSFLIVGISPGHVHVRTEVTPNDAFDTAHIFLRITVANSHVFIYISIVVGWIYFLAWSVSFYPQIYTNFKRKSVVGLNFDFLALNVVGFVLYGIFIVGYSSQETMNWNSNWSPYIENEYLKRNPMGLNSVLLNDVVFALLAMLATLVTIVQCFLFEREDQRVSTVARSILGVFAFLVITYGALAETNTIHWLDFLYYCSYIKLTITLIKYIPQAVMNYRRKSTVGWSIGYILLDFTGGVLSIFQMILNAYNYDDWNLIFGDPTEFGIGLFSVLFDIYFMIQHYILYRDPRKQAQIRENQSSLKLLLDKVEV